MMWRVLTMADKPILFSAPMVRALLEGRKTMTRRVISKARVFATPERPAFTLTGEELARAMQNADRFRHIDGDGWFWEADAFEWQKPHTRTGWMARFGYAPGDRLWVRESFNFAYSLDDEDMPDGEETVYYMADGQPFSRYLCPKTDQWLDAMPWKSSIHMPRGASRLTLIVESVKIERLQDISEQDASAEGAEPAPIHSYVDEYEGPPLTHKRGFANLWNSINGPGAWDANPWVAAYGFRVVNSNIDQVPA